MESEKRLIGKERSTDVQKTAQGGCPYSQTPMHKESRLRAVQRLSDWVIRKRGGGPARHGHLSQARC